jgi:disulfide oxidoreductase YuzD
MINKDIVITTKDVVEREPVTFKRYGVDDILISYANVKCVLNKQDIMDAILSIEEFYPTVIVEKEEVKEEVSPENLQVSWGD